MIEVRQTVAYREWFGGLRDARAKAQIIRRIERAQSGNLGDVAPVGEGVSEMRIHYGPGYRLYFVQKGREIILLLCAGEKSTQKRDIRHAIALAKEL
jgi:putative addiction module killer protein